MSKLKYSLLAGASVFVLGGSALVTTQFAGAQSQGNSSLIDKLVSRFSLNKDEVEAVFDEHKDEIHTQRQLEVSERLQDAVDDGDITTEQKTLIENKMNEMHQAMETEREALETWAEENGIDMRYLLGGRGHGEGNSERLQDAVDDGNITTEQKTLIENKLEELKTTREYSRDELEKWADENGIEVPMLMKDGMGGHGRGENRGF